MGDRLKNWERVLEGLGPLGANLLLLEAQTEMREMRRDARGEPPIRWAHWVQMPEGADAHTLLGLFCEKSSTVIPIGNACMHVGGDHEMLKQVGGFRVYERAEFMGPIEGHARSCTCSLQVRMM